MKHIQIKAFLFSVLFIFIGFYGSSARPKRYKRYSKHSRYHRRKHKKRKLYRKARRENLTKIKKSLVVVKISSVRYNARRPWLKDIQSPYSFIGLVLKNKKILVLANDVLHAAFIEVRKFGSEKRYSAQIIRKDIEPNLALLTVKDKDFFKGLIPLPLGKDLFRGEKAKAVKINSVFQVYEEEISIARVSLTADYGFTELPAINFRTTESFSGGGILVKKGKLAGFISYSSSKNFREACPVSVLRKFIDTGKNEKYKGFVTQGFRAEALIDPVLKNYYHLPKGVTGPVVSVILYGSSAWGYLQKEDIILSVDGIKSDSRGYYEDKRWGRQRIQAIFTRTKQYKLRNPGDIIDVVVFRKGKRIKVRIPLKRYSGRGERVPWLALKRPQYLMEGGFVFLELSVPYLKRRYGSRWRTASVELYRTYKKKRYYKKPSNDTIVILSEALPNFYNRGYGRLHDIQVIGVEGEKIENLKDFAEKLDRLYERSVKNGSHKIISIELAGQRTIYIDISKRSKINRNIKRRYHLTQMRYLRSE